MAQPRPAPPFRTNPVSRHNLSADGTAPPLPRSHIRGQAYCKPTVLPRRGSDSVEVFKHRRMKAVEKVGHWVPERRASTRNSATPNGERKDALASPIFALQFV